ncbi:hypothetical protein [Pseudomonas aeruginosa]|uniref:hypothetical protein n=1 Tax=Pseudomonas aeruginosa TaxID=287 RepID=UPI0010692CDB|nr:hypothetical protein [Pseudomonas aeruginosa]
MITNNSKAPSCTCPSGDGSLVHPCPAHPASVKQAGGDERAAFEAWATHLPMDRQYLRPDLYMPPTQWAWEAWQARAALAQPSPAQARSTWPKLEKPAQVGGVRFSAGVSSRLVVEAAQRLYEFESTPEQEAERIERLQAFREQLDPLNLAPHAEAFNEAPAEALKPEQAEAERPEQPKRYTAGVFYHNHFSTVQMDVVRASDFDEFAAQHERIVGELRFERQQMDRAFTACINERDSWAKRWDETVRHGARIEEQRDAALARVAELETALAPFAAVADAYDDSEDDDHEPYTDMGCDDRLRLTLGQHRAAQTALSGAPSQAQHSVPGNAAALVRAEGKKYSLNAAGMLDSGAPEHAQTFAIVQLLSEFDDEEAESHWEAIMAYSDFRTSDALFHAAELLAAAPGKSVPQAWLDVQAERRRQIEAEGWTPEHDDAHSHGQMARAAACYALAGSSAPNDGTAALLVSLAWPWDEQWWKPSTARRDMVKACALALAEIERLDRAAASQGGPSNA